MRKDRDVGALVILLLGLVACGARADEAALPDSIEPGRTYPIRAFVQNRAVMAGVTNASLLPAYGDSAAGAGKAFLVISTSWENIIPLTLVQRNRVPTAYSIPNLADHLYLIMDGKTLVQLMPRADDLPGHVPVRNFMLPGIGARIRGNLAFEIPAQALRGVQLRFYDFAHGNFSLALTKPQGAEAKPTAAAVGSEVLEIASFGVRKDKELAGKLAQEGTTFVTVDLRARSLVMLDADSTAFDPKAKPGSKIKMGTVADWKDSRKYLQLVVDGEYGYAPLEQTTLPQQPRFLPDLMTGGDVIFLAPESYTSLEVRCDFPNASILGRGVVRPKGVTVAVEGTRPQSPVRSPVASIKDDVFEVSVIGQKTSTAFAGQGASAGYQYLLLTVNVRNTGNKGDFFQPRRQVKHVAENGSQLEIDPATLKGPHAPPELLWVPEGEQRTFEAVFKIPAKETKPRLAYSGVSLARVLALPAIEGSDNANAPVR
jgi:hypothetical protein